MVRKDVWKDPVQDRRRVRLKNRRYRGPVEIWGEYSGHVLSVVSDLPFCRS